MTMFLIQAALLLLIAFIIGAILGCLFHQWFAAAPVEASVAGAAMGVAGLATAAKRPTPPPAPKPVAKPAVKPATAKPKAARVSKPVVRKPAAPKKPAPRKAAPRKAAPKKLVPDNLQKIKGIGAQNEGRLNKVGVMTFAQIAKWTVKQQEEMGVRLAFPGRIEREEWVKQAAVLAKGGQTDFAKRVVRGQVGTSRSTPKKK